MKLSIVIPAYNEEAILGQCLTSIQKEVSKNAQVQIEVLVVNNASTDATKDVALQFSGVKVVDEPSKGLVSARKAGFLASSGELVANIDADVILPDGWLTTVLDTFKKDEQLVALSGPFIYYDLSSFTRAMVKIFYGVGYLTYILNHYVFHVGAMLQGGNFIIKRDAWIRAGGYDTSISFYGEDTDVAKRLSKEGKVLWTFALPAYTSGRRLQKEGIITMSLKYTINYLWITWFNRPFTKKYIDIRPSK